MATRWTVMCSVIEAWLSWGARRLTVDTYILCSALLQVEKERATLLESHAAEIAALEVCMNGWCCGCPRKRYSHQPNLATLVPRPFPRIAQEEIAHKREEAGSSLDQFARANSERETADHEVEKLRQLQRDNTVKFTRERQEVCAV